MMTTAIAPRSSIESRILSLQWVTLCWMLVECSVALTAAWKARSVSLLAFGSDSFVEVVSAVVVLLQFTRAFRVSQSHAAKICGLLLYGLAGMVSLIALAGLYFRVNADTSRLGIAITAGALLLMPVLARMKRDAANQTGGCGAIRNVRISRGDHAHWSTATFGIWNPLARSNRSLGSGAHPVC
jgi:divalent metal cation (Fe/Co/Zn/Cd) transporter